MICEPSKKSDQADQQTEGLINQQLQGAFFHVYFFMLTQETILGLKKKLHAERKKLYVDRQRLTLHPKAGEARGQVLEDDKRVSDYGLKDGDSVLFKDLGPQVGEGGQCFRTHEVPLRDQPLNYQSIACCLSTP